MPRDAHNQDALGLLAEARYLFPTRTEAEADWTQRVDALFDRVHADFATHDALPPIARGITPAKRVAT